MLFFPFLFYFGHYLNVQLTDDPFSRPTGLKKKQKTKKL